MPGFHFSLEQVLRYRQQLKEQAMLETAKAQSARDACALRAGEYAAALLEQRARLSNAAALAEQERWLVARYAASLQEDLYRAKRDLIVLEEELDRRRAELTQRSQDCKLLEKLKTRQAARHAADETQREQRNYDEIATMRFASPAV